MNTKIIERLDLSDYNSEFYDEVIENKINEIIIRINEVITISAIKEGL